jgi:RimJ/RimL family protein N-acetyltransferase
VSSEALRRRYVLPKDECSLLAWRNSSDVAQLQFSGTVLDKEKHRIWFFERLKTAQSRPFLAYENQGVVVGYVRVEFGENDQCYISLLVSPKRRNRGWGFRILVSFLEYFKKEFSSKQLIAYIHPENSASLALFTKANFIPVVTDRSPFLKYKFSL